MKTAVLLFAFLFSLASQAEDSLFTPFREGQSNYVQAKDIKSAQKKFQGHEIILREAGEILLELVHSPREASYDDLLQRLEDLYFRELGKKAGSSYEIENLHKKILILLRGENLIDDTLYRLLEDQVEFKFTPDEDSQGRKTRKTPPAMSLSDYMAKKQLLRNYFDRFTKVSDEIVSGEANNPFPIKDHKLSAGKYRNLTAQDRIFYLYSAQQIREMALILDFALNVADARKIYTTIEFRGSDEPLILTHSPTEQYRLGVRLMRMKKESAENDPRKLGVHVSDLDLIVSAYTLGILSHEELDLIVKNKDFYLPKVSFLRKVGTYFGGLASLAIRVHPVTAPYAIIPVLLYNSYMENKKAKEKIDEESFIFTLPERN